MEFLTLLLVAVALGTDAFALALGIGMNDIKPRQILVISGTVCLYHIFMPLAGLALGSYLGQLVGNVANIIGSVILFLIGLNMIRENLKTYKKLSFQNAYKELKKTPAVLNYLTVKGFASLMLLCLSVSMDALSVGISLGVFHFPTPLTVGIIGIVAGLMTAAGLIMGKKFGDWLGSRAELAGGIILIIIGIKLLM